VESSPESLAEKVTTLFCKIQAGETPVSLQVEEPEVQEVQFQLPIAETKTSFDLGRLVDLNQTTCLNEAKGHEWNNVFSSDESWLESDVDEQLLLNIRFISLCSLHALVIHAANMCNAPKAIKLYANRYDLDFENVVDITPTQTLELSADYFIPSGKEIVLDKFKWSKVSSIALFVEDNLEHANTSTISFLQLLGLHIK